MPTYTYQCKQCQAQVSLNHGMQAQLKPACPQCGGFTERVIQQAPQVLSATPETPTETEAEHACHPGCAMHQLYKNP